MHNRGHAILLLLLKYLKSIKINSPACPIIISVSPAESWIQRLPRELAEIRCTIEIRDSHNCCSGCVQ